MSNSHQLLSDQSESYIQIIQSLFNRPNNPELEFTFDTDVEAKSRQISMKAENADTSTGVPPLAMELLRAIGDIRKVNLTTLQSVAMNASSTIAATAALRRARNVGNLTKGGGGGGGVLKRSSKRVAGILAMRAACSAGVTGSIDGVHGADPLVVEHLSQRMCEVFGRHGAVRLRAPLLRPNGNPAQNGSMAVGPAEFLNTRGACVILPEDLTAPFGKFESLRSYCVHVRTIILLAYFRSKSSCSGRHSDV